MRSNNEPEVHAVQRSERYQRHEGLQYALDALDLRGAAQTERKRQSLIQVADAVYARRA